MARTYLDSNGVTSLVQKIRQKFYTEGDAIEASTVTASGTVDANLFVGKIANSSADTAGSTVGSATQPVYLNSGVITATGSSLAVDITGNAATATTSTTLGTSTVGSGTKPIYLNEGTATASSSTVGSSTRPVYLSSGTITQTGASLAVDVTGNASTATKLANARTVRTYLESTSTASFDGSANITPGVTGTLPVANGGIGATSIDGILSNLGIISDSEIDEVFELVMG